MPTGHFIRTKEHGINISKALNGRTLCVECHKKTHTYGWRVWNYYLKPMETGVMHRLS